MGWIHSHLKVGDKLVVYEGMGMKIGSCTFDVIAGQCILQLVAGELEYDSDAEHAGWGS
jgi:hypothetical protein